MQFLKNIEVKADNKHFRHHHPHEDLDSIDPVKKEAKDLVLLPSSLSWAKKGNSFRRNNKKSLSNETTSTYHLNRSSSADSFLSVVSVSPASCTTVPVPTLLDSSKSYDDTDNNKSADADVFAVAVADTDTDTDAGDNENSDDENNHKTLLATENTTTDSAAASIATAIKTKKKARRSVQFHHCSKNTINYTTVSIRDMTREEVQNTWYSYREITNIKQSNFKLLRKWKAPQQKNKNDTNAKSSYNKFTDYSKDLKRNETLRGLELLCETTGQKFLFRTELAKQAVLRTQSNYNAKAKNTNTNDCCCLIARNCICYTKICQEEAYQRGMIDEVIARNIYDLYDALMDNENGTTTTSIDKENDTMKRKKTRRASLFQRFSLTRKKKQLQMAET